MTDILLESAQAAYTREEVTQRATSLARTLFEKIGNKKTIAVRADRSPEMIFALYGVLFSGNAYLPLPVDAPEERLRYMTETAGVSLCVCDRAEHSLPWTDTVVLQNFPYTAPTFVDGSIEAEDIAYVLFTSGSTGKPKGARISHRAFYNRLAWMEETYPLRGGKILQKTPYTFDVSVWEIFRPLIFGGGLVLMPPRTHTDPRIVAEYVEKYNVTQLHFVPSVYSVYLEYAQKEKVPTVPDVFLSGEALKPALVQRHFALFGTTSALHNLYGPTECAVDVAYYDCTGTETIVPIGKPIKNCSLSVIDESGAALPPHTTGELLISGVPVGSGYVGSDQGGFSNGSFRTGDLCYYDENGDYYFVGRKDRQIKLHGQRVELGEIERVVESLSSVRTCAVCLDKTETLSAFVVGSATEADVLTVCQRYLPNYMIPSRIEFVKELPITENGKRNLASLLSADVSSRGEDKTNAVVETVEKLLRCRGVTAEDRFFDIGGDSIRAIHLSARLRERGYTVSVKQIMEEQTLFRIAEVMVPSTETETTHLSSAVVSDQEKIEETFGADNIERIIPLTPLQEGMLFHTLAQGDFPEYFTQKIIETERLNPQKTVQVLSCLFKKYDVLRTAYIFTENKSYGIVLKNRLPDFSVCLEKTPEEIANEHLKQGFDLSKDSLYRLAYTEENGKGILVQSIHHIIMDGWSEHLFREDFFRLYRLQELPSAPNNVVPSFASYVEAITAQDKSEGLAYYKKLFKDFEGARAYPTTKRTKARSERATVLSFPLSEKIKNALDNCARRYSVTLPTVLQSIWGVLLNRANGTQDCVFGNVFSGRTFPFPNIEKTVGMFINTLPIRVTTKNADFASVLRSVAEQNLKAQSYEYLSLAELNCPFSTVVVIENYGQSSSTTRLRSELDQTNYGLEFQWNEECFYLRFLSSLYTEKEILSLGKEIERLITECCDRPEQKEPLLPVPDGILPTQTFPAHPPLLSRRLRLPSSDEEKSVAQAVGVLLSVAEVYADDDFFDLGGDSIKAIRLSAKMKNAGYEITVKQIMENRTVSAVAACLKKSSFTEFGSSFGIFPLSPVQRHFFDEQYPQPDLYIQDVLLRFDSVADTAAVKKALLAVYNRHDLLRARLFGDRLAIFSPKDSAPLYFSSESLSSDDRTTLYENCDRARKKIRLDGEFLFIAAFFATPNRSYLYLCAHHLLADGVSWQILTDDFYSAYRAYSVGSPPVPPPNTSSFAAWSSACSSFTLSEREKSYWKNIESSLSDSLIPSDGSPICTVERVLDSSVTDALLGNVGSFYKVNTNDILLTALAKAVSSVFGLPKTALTLESHGRQPLFPSIDVTRTVGWFTSAFPVLLNGEGDLLSCLLDTKETLRRISQEGIGYQFFDRSVRPSLIFNYLGSMDTDSDIGLTPLPLPVPDVNPEKEVLDVEAKIIGGKLCILFYANGVSEEKTNRFADCFSDWTLKAIALCRSAKQPTYTPSDFKITDISKEDFEDILSALAPDVPEEIAPLTYMQEGMLYHTLTAPARKEYVEQEITLIERPYAEEKMRTALAALAERYSVLRTRYLLARSGNLWQASLKNNNFSLEYYSEEWQSAAEKEQSLLNPTGKLPIRTAVASVTDSSFVLIWTSHHITYDAWCNAPLFEQFLSLYDGVLTVEELTEERRLETSFFEYARTLRRTDRTEALSYWHEILKNAHKTAPLFKQGLPSGTVASSKKILSIQDFSAFDRAHAITENTVFETALSLLLFSFTGQTDICYGKVISGRTLLRNTQNTVGLFINTVPVCVRNGSVESVLSQIKNQSLRADEYGICSLSELFRNERMTDPIEVLFVNNGFSVPRGEGFRSLSSRDSINYPLCFGIETSPFRAEIIYDPAVFDKQQVDDFINAFDAAVSDLVKHNTVPQIKTVPQGNARDFPPQLRCGGDGDDSVSVRTAERHILSAVREVAGTPAGEHTPFRELGVSSLDRIRIAVRLPKSLFLSAEDVALANSVHELALFSVRHRTGSYFLPQSSGHSVALVCIPYAGGTGRVFDSFVDSFPDVDVVSSVFCTVPEEKMPDYIEEFRLLCTRYEKIVLFSHCLGAFAAMRLSHAVPVDRIVFSGFVPSPIASFFGHPINEWKKVSDEKIAFALEKAGLPDARELSSAWLPLFRTDTERVAVTEASFREKITASASVILASGDSMTDRIHAKSRWKKFLPPPVDVRTVDANNHYYLQTPSFVDTLKTILHDYE